MSTDTSSHIQGSKPVEFVYDEDRIKILIDDTRKQILSLLAQTDHEMSVTEIATGLGTNPQRIYHHVDKLLDYGFIEKTREIRKKRSVTSYYSRTADAFVVSYSTNRRFIKDAELSSHYIDHFENILGISFSREEITKMKELLPKIATMSESIFKRFSSNEEIDENRLQIENLYFLLEYMIFMSNPEAKKLQEQLNELIIPKFSQKPEGVKAVRY